MKTTYVAIITTLLMACGGKQTDNPILAEANKIHIESIAIQEAIEPKIEQLDSLKSTLNDSTKIAKLEDIKKMFIEWEEGLLEVPGFEHQHHNHEGHSHKHKPAPEMTDESMLEYQKNTKKAIEELQAQLNELLLKNTN
ncbi:MAG: hypothetical protein MUF45_02285 [Spirosomaceae bacterium]|jgi:hypothetical protein|nr:hypothetical protein [Spirosomataceae bacterium]